MAHHTRATHISLPTGWFSAQARTAGGVGGDIPCNHRQKGGEVNGQYFFAEFFAFPSVNHQIFQKLLKGAPVSLKN
jgi:hypothetical protein